MGRNWTEEQKQVISLRNRNILVSAAAGSGKTAVLVERILSKITDKKNPVDIDRLLIMTFTRAAAGEMRERIGAALENALYEDPDNEHLQRQSNLIHTAQITTIDGFCAYIIRNYFHLIGLDPGYRTGDEGELKLLKGDVVRKLLEDAYAEGDKRFLSFVECFASGKTDSGLESMILKLYESAMSNPYPEEWLERCLNAYKTDTLEEMKQTKWIKMLWECAEDELEEAESLCKEALSICLECDGPFAYEEALNSDLLFLAGIRSRVEAEDYDGTAELLAKPSFARLSAKKMPDADGRKKERVKALREEEKTILKELGSRYFHSSIEEVLETVRIARVPMEALVALTLEFGKRYGEAKREKNILDFTDMEHFALAILMEKDGDKIRMSQAAEELSGRYDEVLVDEYQDSNLVQESLTQCVSGWINQRKNIFMVGDVKQSIYRFRLARPELFMEKYKRYSLKDSEEQRIDLHKNFRSRAEVLESVNFIFRQVMGEDLGGISYDEAAALYPGAVFPEGGSPDFAKTEVLLVERDGEELEDERGMQNAIELEALAVAQKINAIVGKEQIVDKKTGEYRPVEYGDIVILLRSASGWADTFREVLASQEIPAYSASKTGYFSALEVVTVLNFLRICDNPRQDIPMAGVLRSPICGCTSQELAVLKSRCPEGILYESVCAFAGLEPEDKEQKILKDKLVSFLELLEKTRGLAVCTPVHQLILYVLRETGYGSYARALPGGEQRYANLSMLVEKAMAYEKTSYRGLFNFVRYIEQLQKYEVDYGEVNLSGAGMGTVQIMTIHKSKGLEFPVVFVSGMGKQFNFQDINAQLLLHPEMGIGADAVQPEKRITAVSLHKQIMRRELLKESLGEELRVLYVALTRAREKLIMTGTVTKAEKLFASLARFMYREDPLLSMGVRMKAKNYWSFVLPALARHRGMRELFEKYGIPVKRVHGFYEDKAEFSVQLITVKELAEQEIIYMTGSQIKKEILKEWDAEKTYDAQAKQEIEKRFSFRYPYEYLKEIPVKVSVSELKKRSWREESDYEEAVYEEPELTPLVPAFMAEKEEEYTGSARGTAYHRIMECLDFGRASSMSAVMAQVRELQEQKKLSEAEARSIRVKDIKDFMYTQLGQRMAAAAGTGCLYREQPFVFSRNASEIDGDWNGEETVLVQGIIDAYFYEEGEIVLVDYKTDRINPGEEQKLLERYRSQLDDYAQALTRMTGRNVKEKYIYSFTLHEEIPVI